MLYEQPALWASLTIHVPDTRTPAAAERAAPWLAGKEALLRRVAPLVTELKVEGAQLNTLVERAGRGNAGGIAMLLAALQPAGAVERLHIVQRHPMIVSGTSMAPADMGAVAALPRLRQLRLRLFSVEARCVEVLGMTGLTSLTLHAGSFCSPDIRPLTSLSRLEELEISGFRMRLLSAAAFPVLRRLAQVAYALQVSAGVHARSWLP